MVRVRRAFLTLFAVAVPAAAVAQTPPAAPAAVDAAQIVTLLDKFCVPAIKGTPIGKLTGPVGLRKNRDDELVLPLGLGKKITVTPPDSSNPTVCTLTVLYDVGGDAPIYSALSDWAQAHSTPFAQTRTKESSQVGGETHVISAWEGMEADGDEGLVFIQARTVDGKPLTHRADQATILFSIRPN
jgi:hypothetical protein